MYLCSYFHHIHTFIFSLFVGDDYGKYVSQPPEQKSVW
jgi:hypothetical protein